MRFIVIVLLLALAGLAALYVYGQMLEPDMRTIEQEAVRADGP